jgi:hypothetical protein
MNGNPPTTDPVADLVADPAPDLVLSIDVGEKNLGLCCLRPGGDPKGGDDRICYWIVTSTLPGCHALAETLREAGVMDWLPRVRDVVIERQNGRNTKMVRLQCYLEMFFTLHGKFVAIADPCHKLNFAACTPHFPFKDPPAKWTYYFRKKASIQSTQAFLEATAQPEAAKHTFARSSKKDDLGDSLWQGMAYAHFVAPLQNVKAQAKRSKVPAPRKPTAKQLAVGKLSKSHVVFIVRNDPHALSTLDGLHKACEAFKPLKKGLVRHFGSVEFAFRVLRDWALEHKFISPNPDPNPDQ